MEINSTNCSKFSTNDVAAFATALHKRCETKKLTGTCK